MSDNTYNPSSSSAPAGDPEIRQRRVRVSLIWLVPIVAALVGLSMVAQSWLSAGPQITVSFLTAEGLEANKTQVKYKNVVIGRVTGITLSEDRTRVVATIELDQNTEAFIREDAQLFAHASAPAAYRALTPCCPAPSSAQTRAMPLKPTANSSASKPHHQ